MEPRVVAGQRQRVKLIRQSPQDPPVRQRPAPPIPAYSTDRDLPPDFVHAALPANTRTAFLPDRRRLSFSGTLEKS